MKNQGLKEDVLINNYRSDRPFLTLLGLYGSDQRKLGLSFLFYLIKHSPEWLRPVITANIIDIISHPQQHDLSALGINGAILAFSILQNLFTNHLHVWYMSSATRNMEKRLRFTLAQKFQWLEIGYYQRRSSGVLQSKVLRDVDEIHTLTTAIFQFIPSAVLTILIAIAITAQRAPGFLVFFLLTIPIGAALIRFFKAPVKQRNYAFRQRIEQLSGRLIESIQLIPITRAHGAENIELNRVDHHLSDVKQAALRLDVINSLANASAWVTLRLLNVFCLVVSAFLAYTQQLDITVGDVVLLTGYFETITASVIQILMILPQIGKGFEAIRSIGEVLEAPDIEHNQGKVLLTEVQGEFCFEQVGFSYTENFYAAIEDFNLKIHAGEVIAFVGASGAGKSTLLSLIIGFLRPTQGRILLDGRDMNELDLRTYRQFLAVVTQETILFSGTVRDNITYGILEVTDQELKQAIIDANAEEFIGRLPQGLETLIGENGAKLSGGQRQRIAIARALIRNPRVLILDEATASLDSASESLIQEALERLMQNRTTLIVAHRLSTIRQADRIVVIDQGKIVEMGNHAELLVKQGLYAQYYALQT